MSIRGVLLMGMGMSFVVSLAAAAEPDAPAPEKPGVYPVGVTTMQFTDYARTDALTKKPRSLLTEIWYPATDETQGLPKNRLMDFLMRGTDPALPILLQAGFNLDANELDKRFKNTAVRDARIRDGLFPLIVFSHGDGGLRFQNTFLCEHLASHGYIVAAPDHTGNAAITYVDGQLVAYDASSRKQAETDRPLDIVFLINTFQRLNSGADSRFLARIDMEKIAAAGHSFGGYTSTCVAGQDPRIKAILPLAGVAEDKADCPCPVMLMLATEDKTMGLDGDAQIRKYYDTAKGPRYLVEFKNAGHFSFTEVYQFKPDFGDGVGTGKRLASGESVAYITMDVMYPLVNGYATAFFGKYLKGIDAYDAYLKENHNPDELLYKAETGPAS